MQEQLNTLDELPNYLISDQGEVYPEREGDALTHWSNKEGITCVSVTLFGRRTTRSLALLVARAHIPNNKDWFNSIIHLNGNRADCRASNLMWRPRMYVTRYHAQFDTHLWANSMVPVCELTTGEDFECQQDASMTFGIRMGDIHVSCMNEEPFWDYEFRFLK